MMTPLERAWLHYGGEILTRSFSDQRQKAKCPLHEDRHASAYVNLESQKWHCFAGCGYGDVCDLIQKVEKINSYPAQRRFAVEHFGFTADPYTEYAAPIRNAKPKKKWVPPWK